MENTLENLSNRIDKIENRNKKVEMDKTWETSTTRKVSVALLTYISITLYFLAIGIERPFLNATVPTLGFLLSTLSLTLIRKVWEEKKQS